MHLQNGGRPAFMQRLILAATLGANYGIYGPAFELCENIPIKQGSEEYLDSENTRSATGTVPQATASAPLITQINQIRRDNPALQSDGSLHFHPADNPNIICYSKSQREQPNPRRRQPRSDPGTSRLDRTRLEAARRPAQR